MESTKGGTEIAPRRSGAIEVRALILLMDLREFGLTYLFMGHGPPVAEPAADEGW
ncbi:hypothetical protein KXS07_36745 [Inquilinus limosus]|uniref:hypothetical protein n=1 Tax=Inquilinus limosus TaxID=171674 RepID=UPI003F172318